MKRKTTVLSILFIVVSMLTPCVALPVMAAADDAYQNSTMPMEVFEEDTQVHGETTALTEQTDKFKQKSDVRLEDVMTEYLMEELETAARRVTGNNMTNVEVHGNRCVMIVKTRENSKFLGEDAINIISRNARKRLREKCPELKDFVRDIKDTKVTNPRGITFEYLIEDRNGQVLTHCDIQAGHVER